MHTVDVCILLVRAYCWCVHTVGVSILFKLTGLFARRNNCRHLVASLLSSPIHCRHCDIKGKQREVKSGLTLKDPVGTTE